MGIILKIQNLVLGYNDLAGVNGNPLMKAFDWNRKYESLPAENGSSDFDVIPPAGSLTLFDGTRTLPSPLIAGTSVLSIANLQTDQSTYRISVSGGGAFRTQRSTSIGATSQIAVALNNNAIATFTISVAGNFSSVQVGDIVRIKGAKTGDLTSTIFSASNSGYWVVLAATASALTVKRLAGENFEGVTETVTIGATDTANQFIVYSAAGVQTTDSVILQGTFSSASWGNYKILQVAPSFIDIISGIPLPQESGLTLASITDLVVYTNSKKLVYIEGDQNMAIRYNLDTSDNNLVEPVLVNSEIIPGFSNKWGFTWKCVVVNKSTVNPLNLKWILAE